MDRRHEELQEAGLPIEAFDDALCKEYDYIVITVQGEELTKKSGILLWNMALWRKR